MDSNSIPGRFELWSGFLSILQVFYTSDAARESFVELCEEEYVQKAGSASPTIFHKCPIFQTWGNEKKTKNVARFSSELSKAIQFQGKFASKF